MDWDRRHSSTRIAKLRAALMFDVHAYGDEGELLHRDVDEEIRDDGV